MTRGNQRELARAKNLKKNQDAAKKNKDDGLTASARKVGGVPFMTVVAFLRDAWYLGPALIPPFVSMSYSHVAIVSCEENLILPIFYICPWSGA